MKPLATILAVVMLAALMISMLAIPPALATGATEETPILGSPVIVTPIHSPVPGTDGPSVAPSAGTPGSTGTAAPSPVTTATAAPSNRPDACEPNNLAEQACPLPLDAVSGPFTIVPEDDQDFFRLDLPQEASIETLVTVRATDGLDLVITARQGETLIASGTYSLTLVSTIAGPVTLRVENRDPRLAAGESYRIEVRRSIVPPAASDEANSRLRPDPLENNWSFATAAPIAVGVVYDLTLVCPEARPDACPGGDHDYLLVPVKAGTPYLLATFDLGPGVDPVLELFWDETTTAVAGNDDYGPSAMLAALTWTAPHDGLLGVRIAPRNGGLAQHLSLEAEAGYRFAIAPVASELAGKLSATLRQQANLPTPSATAAPTTVAPPPAGGSSGAASGAAPAGGAGQSTATEQIASGPAVIVRETVLHREPRAGSTGLATLSPETQVTVRGPVNGLWVSVESAASILPGWVLWSDLQRTTATTGSPGPLATTAGANAAPPSQVSGGTATSGTPVTTPTRTAPTATPAVQVSVSVLDPALPPAPPPPAPRVPVVLTIMVVATDTPPTGSAVLGMATPTPDLHQPVAEVRVQLVNAFGDLLAEGRTDAQGRLRLSRDVGPRDMLHVRVPAWGVELPLAPEQALLVITIPEGQR